MDINKVFPKSPEVVEEMRQQKAEQLLQEEAAELARVKALAPVVVPPTMNQLMAAQIGGPSQTWFHLSVLEGHTVDMPVSNPFLPDKLIDDELKQMLDMQVSEKRRGCVRNMESRIGNCPFSVSATRHLLITILLL